MWLHCLSFLIDTTTNYKLENYHPIVCKTRLDNDRGGVGLYVSAECDYRLRDDLTLFIPHIIESLFVEIVCQESKLAFSKV